MKISQVMSKKVIVCEGDFRVFRTLGEVSEALDVSPSAVSMALGDGRLVRGLRMRWADRVFLVRSDGRWVVCIEDSRGRMVEMDGGGVIGRRKVEAVKDITAAFYYSKEIW